MSSSVGSCKAPLSQRIYQQNLLGSAEPSQLMKYEHITSCSFLLH